MIDDLVSQIEARFGELQEELSDPDVIADRERFTAASRAYRELEPAAKLVAEYRRAADDFAGARELIAEDGDDPDIRALLESSRKRMETLEEEIRLAMVERDHGRPLAGCGKPFARDAFRSACRLCVPLAGRRHAHPHR